MARRPLGTLRAVGVESEELDSILGREHVDLLRRSKALSGKDTEQTRKTCVV